MTADRVRREGDAAVRPRERWTPAVQAALVHLRSRGFVEAPEPLGFDEHDERVRWLDGDSGADGWARLIPDAGLVELARLLRRLHAAGEGFVLAPEHGWADQDAPHRGGTLCHGDPGPWNVVWSGTRAVGLIDGDLVHLGDPLTDVHYALEYAAPFRDDEEAIRWMRHPGPPDRAVRIRTFWRAYARTDDVPLEALVDGVIAQQRATTALAARLAEEGVEPQATWFREGHGAVLDARVRWSEENRDAIVAEGDRA